MHTAGAEVSGFIGILIVQITILIIYGIFVRYDFEMLPAASNSTTEELAAIDKQHRVSYPRKFMRIFCITVYSLTTITTDNCSKNNCRGFK